MWPFPFPLVSESSYLDFLNGWSNQSHLLVLQHSSWISSSMHYCSTDQARILQSDQTALIFCSCDPDIGFDEKNLPKDRRRQIISKSSKRSQDDSVTWRQAKALEDQLQRKKVSEFFRSNVNLNVFYFNTAFATVKSLGKQTRQTMCHILHQQRWQSVQPVHTQNDADIPLISLLFSSTSCMYYSEETSVHVLHTSCRWEDQTG